MFALGRLVSIPCATRFTPAFMLLCNITGCLLAMVLMLALQHNHVALYFGTCFFGLFMSSVTPTALSLAEQYIDVNCEYIQPEILRIFLILYPYFVCIIQENWKLKSSWKNIWWCLISTSSFLLYLGMFAFEWLAYKCESIVLYY